MKLNILCDIAYIFFEGQGLCVFELMPLLHKNGENDSVHIVL